MPEHPSEICSVVQYVIDCTHGLRSWDAGERQELVDRICAPIERLTSLTDAQRATLDQIDGRADMHDGDGGGFDRIAFEIATGDPVIFNL